MQCLDVFNRAVGDMLGSVPALVSHLDMKTAFLFCLLSGTLFKNQEIHMSVPASNTIILVTRNGMGEADTTLQHKLIQAYFRLLDENNILPAAICFYSEGVKLLVAGSPVLETVKSLESKGVHCILCSTCLEFFNLTNQVQVGIIGGMTDIIEAQFRADKVISI